MARLLLSHSHSELGRMSVWLDQQERLLAMPNRVAHAVRMCLEEAIVNLVEHTAPASDGPDITIDLGWRGGTLVVAIEDGGPPFDPREVPPPARPRTLDEAIPGGLGILLIRSFASEIDYTTAHGRNRLTLRFASPADAEPACDRI
jgi:serine/threonine-protein kinase RsbW